MLMDEVIRKYKIKVRPIRVYQRKRLEKTSSLARKSIASLKSFLVRFLTREDKTVLLYKDKPSWCSVRSQLRLPLEKARKQEIFAMCKKEVTELVSGPCVVSTQRNKHVLREPFEISDVDTTLC